MKIFSTLILILLVYKVTKWNHIISFNVIVPRRKNSLIPNKKNMEPFE